MERLDKRVEFTSGAAHGKGLRHAVHLAEEAAHGKATLLGPDQLLAAIAGHITQGSALIGWARELGDLHAALIPVRMDRTRLPADFDEARVHIDVAKIISEIDSWALFHVPRARGARRHTHSLGEVISHIAKTYADAWWAVLLVDDKDLRHEAWFHLGEVCEGYAQLIDDVQARGVRFPVGRRGMRHASPA
ncbi:hypothetical protein LTT66_32615 [Nocardia gipuzkoensis]|uniref:hypothetical protein n=1 Tax=Nocardia gipuzkoensis TaxID=2749991 RepID=UPI001E2EE3B2|nr:hypothetical protein [Nocardia gipuzkoensis]UGT67870.1 hypothetical protein LTT66_32615 [Nocardia gipuzkoensis]